MRPFFAAFDDEFLEKSERHGVTFVRRDERSASIDEPPAIQLCQVVADMSGDIQHLDYFART